MTARLIAKAALLLSVACAWAETADVPAVRRFHYTQRKAPDYVVTQEVHGADLVIRYDYGSESRFQIDSVSRRVLPSGELASLVVYPGGNPRTYRYQGDQIEVVQTDGRITHVSVTHEAQAELLDSICAFARAGKETDRVFYVAQAARSFRTQGFFLYNKGWTTATTPAGTFHCMSVRLALDPPMGLFFSLDFEVAVDGIYPFVVRGRTMSGGDFELSRME